MDIPPVNIGPERIISSCDGVAIKEKDFKYRVRQTSIYVHGTEYYNAAEADRYIAHQKYKRCLDQVENCRTSSVYFFRISEGEKDEGKAAEYRRVSDWFNKWEERWLELSKKFKEAKNG